MKHLWYQKEKEEVFFELKTETIGLKSEEAAKRLELYGLNEISKKKKRNFLWLFFSQFKSPLIYVLLVTALITYFLKHSIDTWVILGVVFFNAFIGLIQEKKAEKAMEALKKLVSHKAEVLRDGELKSIFAIHVVPGDIVNLESGGRVPADIRLIEANNLKADEAILTGESIPDEKFSQALKGDLSIGDQDNMVFMGTPVVSGKGLGVAVATGEDTEFGKIAEIVAKTEESATPLQLRLAQFSKQLVWAIVFVALLIFAVGILRGIGLLQMFLVAVSAAVSAIPEGLPAVITITLAIGVFGMAKRKAILKKLMAVETLGSVNLLASDKTGTLTKNQMTVFKVYFDGEIVEIKENQKLQKSKEKELLFPLLEAGILCNDAILRRSKQNWAIDGDPTEGALLVLGEKFGLNKESLEEAYPRIAEIPFDPKNRMVATLHERLEEGSSEIFVRGAIEEVLKRSSFLYKEGKKVPLTDFKRKEILKINEEFCKEALRVVAVAKKESKKSTKLESSHIKDLVFLGLLGMYDPPRPEAKEAVRQCKKSGIKVVMITGDHSITAKAIAKQIGIIENDEEQVVSGEELEKMSSEQLEDTLNKVSVYARISPEMKFKIVETLQNNGWIVGVTGDGVNDAPALKKADIGIAMGVSGTDVSREAADLVLMDDNFATIVAAIEEGRTIFQNIRRVIFYLISTGIGEVLTIIVALISGMPLPLLPVQILWINLVTDGTADVALAMEPKHEGIMGYPPRPLKEHILNKVVSERAFLVGAYMMIGSIILFYLELLSGSSIERARTVIFVTLVMFQIFNVLNSRSMSVSIFKTNFWSNPYTMLSMSASFLLVLSTIYIPFVRGLFHTTELGISDWLRAILVSVTIIGVVEIDKMIRNLGPTKSYSKAEKSR